MHSTDAPHPARIVKTTSPLDVTSRRRLRRSSLIWTHMKVFSDVLLRPDVTRTSFVRSSSLRLCPDVAPTSAIRKITPTTFTWAKSECPLDAARHLVEKDNIYAKVTKYFFDVTFLSIYFKE